MFCIIRFSTEDVSASTPEKKPKPTTPTRSRNSADWLGLKTNDENSNVDEDAGEKKTSNMSSKAPSSPLLERQSSPTSSHVASAVEADTSAPTINVPKQTKPGFSKSHEKEKEDDWLAGALSRKKTLSVSRSEVKQEPSGGLGEEVDQESDVR